VWAKKYSASSGNRTRAARVAGEHSTTEPTMLDRKVRDFCRDVLTSDVQRLPSIGLAL
jgi:hypothetical protein